MNTTTNVSVRMDVDLKKQAEELFADLGLNMTVALTMFLRQAVREQGIPFGISRNKPNPETIAALHEIEYMRAGLVPKQSMSVADFAKEMGV